MSADKALVYERSLADQSQQLSRTVDEQQATAGATADRELDSAASWTVFPKGLDSLCNQARSQSYGCRIIFVSKPSKEKENRLNCSRLSQAFGIPPRFWLPLSREANGYFRALRSTGTSSNDHEFRTEWRLLSKQPESAPDQTPNDPDKKYIWDEISFFTFWSPRSGTTVLCFDAHIRVQKYVREAMTAYDIHSLCKSPFGIHDLLLSALVVNYDQAVWQWRDLVRDREKKRPTVERPTADYRAMHDLQRHITHSTENLTNAINVVEEMVAANERLISSRFGIDNDLSDIISDEFHYHKSVLNFLRQRSIALESRLAYEINLVLHINTQHDSQIAQSIADATARDSTVTKTIGVAGLLFLPGTFMSAIFSMSFFNFTPATEDVPGRWTVSNRFWIYWVITIPLTLITFLFFTNWQRQLNQSQNVRTSSNLWWRPAHISRTLTNQSRDIPLSEKSS